MLRRKCITILLMRAALLVHGTTGSAESLPSFGSQDELEVVAAVGRDAVFKCTVHNIMHYQTAWLEMKKGIVYAMGDDLFTENPRISVHHSLALNGEQSWVLTIKDVNMNDAGKYMCSLNTAVSLRKYYRLTVVVPPKIMDANTSSDIEVREGQRARLVCGASGTPEPTYKWRREDSKLIDVSGNTDLLVDGRELVFESALREHAGAYLCIASNGVPPSVSKRIMLSVRFEPQIRAFEPRLWVTLGSTVNLSCVVDGFPEPAVEWLRDYGQPVTGQSYFNHVTDPLMQVNKYVEDVVRVNATRRIIYLVVNDVRKMDLMGYRCRANNSEGASEAQVVLYEEQTTTYYYYYYYHHYYHQHYHYSPQHRHYLHR
ncbi:lachesin-like [Panulirus ornatus]|uniref:lachesin-like n=1 Tax=Panulirus ornatus TaxID=150431 RepID=UPI003A850C7A